MAVVKNELIDAGQIGHLHKLSFQSVSIAFDINAFQQPDKNSVF